MSRLPGGGRARPGTALGILANNNDDDDLDNIGLVILDNNTNRAGGGFWTTYHQFAPLLLTSCRTHAEQSSGWPHRVGCRL